MKIVDKRQSGARRAIVIQLADLEFVAVMYEGARIADARAHEYQLRAMWDGDQWVKHQDQLKGGELSWVG